MFRSSWAAMLPHTLDDRVTGSIGDARSVRWRYQRYMTHLGTDSY